MSTSLTLAQRTVSGKVTDAAGDAVIGASVFVKEAPGVGTITDVDGMYQLNVPSNGNTLVFSYTGFETFESAITGGSVNVTMQEGKLLDEVVVTAIGISRSEKTLGYAVQSLDNEKIEKAGTTGVLNSLTGKVAGVQITNTSGAAGASSNVLIRGAASLTGNNQPLYVVDGVPINGSQTNTGSALSGVANSDRTIDVNPDDIESISILKGGAATALYGMRAANGVIMINTKSGKKGKVRIDFNSSIAIDQVNKLPEMQNIYAQGIGGNLNLGTSAVFGPKLSDLAYDPNNKTRDYPEGQLGLASAISGGTPARAYDPSLFFNNGYAYNNNVSIAGGTDKSEFFFSFGNLSQTGVVPNNTFNRTSASLRGAYNITDKLKISARVAYTKSGGTRIQQGSNTSGVMLGLLRMPANFDIFGGVSDPSTDKSAYENPDGTQRNAYRGGIYDNPLWTAYNNPFTDDVNRIISWAQVDYKFNDWISAMYRVGNDFFGEDRKSIFAIGSRTVPGGRIIDDKISARDFNSDLILKLSPKINDNFGLNILLGNNLFSTQSDRNQTIGDGLAIAKFYNLSNTANQVVNQAIGRKRTSAYYADFGMDYKNMLYFNVTLRNEQSTTLPDGNNSFFFPSFNTAWILSEMPFLQNNDILSFAKLRGSWSVIANDAPIYLTEQTFTRGQVTDGWTSTNPLNFPAFGVNSFQVNSTLANPNLKPEFITSRELGVDLRFLNNRLGLDVTYYNNLSEDLIMNVPVARSSGASFASLNAATMVNKGWEVLLTSTPVANKDFSWNLDINWTKNISEVLSLADGVENVFLAGFTGSQTRAVVGEPYGSIFGDRWTRHSNGQVLINESGFPAAAGEDDNIGNTLPEWILGINNSFNYKNIGFSFLWDIKKGGYMWNGTRGAMNFFGTSKETETRELTNYVFEGVTADGQPNTKQVQLGENWYRGGEGSGFTGPAEPYVEKADWVRLREVTLSYKLPKSLLSNLKVQDTELYFTGRNLFLSTPYTGIDPETSLIGQGNGQGLEYFNMPGTKSYVFGLRVGF
ncbi:MAG: SusC/RagA family TonB-linked outer membrane protein [Rivularia sp. (in: cyanobacteria)]